jgi:2,4-dienoyl-CoA reductase-like NADH-dependent reductase (Old Yellow Enzyme family)
MTSLSRYTPIAQLRDAAALNAYLRALKIALPFDEALADGESNPLAQPYQLKSGLRIGNRFCTLPMEGWDGTLDGRPTELTKRRWLNFGHSGAKLIWGGEAVAVRPDGRANPNQLLIAPHTLRELESLREETAREHVLRFRPTDSLVIGLQLTHSGRFSRPNQRDCLEPKIAYHHPLLDELFGLPPDLPVLSDLEIDDLVIDFITAAARACEIGFDFVDIKHCHGYLGHELLGARTRPGRYGGDFTNRTRFLREIIKGIQRECPRLAIGVRISAFDFPPFRAASVSGARALPLEFRNERGEYPFAFGSDPHDPCVPQLDETVALLGLLEELGVELVCVSAGSPYYNPHIQRPAFFPPSDGYLPPEDPLVGVARQVNVVAELKARVPGMALIGSAYSYLQEWFPNVAQRLVRTGMVDFVGLGRMLLAYPDFPADILEGRGVDRKRLCRTFSDCTTAPRNGLVSGCYPLNPAYKELPEADQLRQIKARLRRTDPEVTKRSS